MLPDLKCDRLSAAIRVNHYVDGISITTNLHGLQRDQAPAPVGERHGGCAFGQYLYAATDDRIEDRSLEYMELEMVTNGTNRRGHIAQRDQARPWSDVWCSLPRLYECRSAVWARRASGHGERRYEGAGGRVIRPSAEIASRTAREPSRPATSIANAASANRLPRYSADRSSGLVGPAYSQNVSRLKSA